MLRPMGLPENVRVIAWGLSLERPTMIKYKIENIRDLFGHKADLLKQKTVKPLSNKLKLKNKEQKLKNGMINNYKIKSMIQIPSKMKLSQKEEDHLMEKLMILLKSITQILFLHKHLLKNQ